MATFNITTEPCIPVRMGGAVKLLSVLDTLKKAGKIERIENASPLSIVALHRFLLALLYRLPSCPEDFDDLQDWLEAGFPINEIEAYLAQYATRFDLFDPDRPFFQISDLDKAVFNGNPIQPKSWTELSPEVRDGGRGASLFNHENDLGSDISAAEAFQQLLVRQTFSLGGLSRTFDYSAKRAPSPNAAFFLAQGKTLLETLCCNLDPDIYALHKRDVPFWEAESGLTVSDMQASQSAKVMGCVQAYTWYSRSVKLIALEKDDGFYVRQLYLASGLAPELDVARYFDPMIGQSIAKSGKYQGEQVFTRLRSKRKFWRDFHSLFGASGDSTPPKVINISLRLAAESKLEPSLGVYGLSNATQEAKIDFARQEHFLLPQALTQNRTTDVYTILEDALTQADDMHKGLRRACKELVTLLLKRNSSVDPDPKEVTAMLERTPGSQMYWSMLERAFHDLLAKLTPDFKPRRVQADWQEQLIAVSNQAWSLMRQFAGTDAYALRAIYSAEKFLRTAQKPLPQTQEAS